MLYDLFKTVARDIPPVLLVRGLRDVKLSSLAIFGYNYLKHEGEVARQNRVGTLSPTSLNLELTSFCPYRCRGCYVPIRERKEEEIIDPALAHKIVQEAVDLGVRVINLYGGEPLQSGTVGLIEDIVKTHPTVPFFSCTNGDYLARNVGSLDSLVDQPNYSVALSIDGFEITNDNVRGRESFQKIVRAADYLKSRKALFGGVITVRDENKEDVLSDEFVDYLIGLGWMYMAYSISGQLADVSEVLTRMQKLKKKPVFEYNAEGGPEFTHSKRNVSRAVFAKKDGSIILLRGERDLVLGQSIQDATKDQRWQALWA